MSTRRSTWSSKLVLAVARPAWDPRFPPMNGVMYQSADARFGTAAIANIAIVGTRNSLRTIHVIPPS